jgi:hypothetical protein
MASPLTNSIMKHNMNSSPRRLPLEALLAMSLY